MTPDFMMGLTFVGSVMLSSMIVSPTLIWLTGEKR